MNCISEFDRGIKSEEKAPMVLMASKENTVKFNTVNEKKKPKAVPVQNQYLPINSIDKYDRDLISIPIQLS